MSRSQITLVTRTLRAETPAEAEAFETKCRRDIRELHLDVRLTRLNAFDVRLVGLETDLTRLLRK